MAITISETPIVKERAYDSYLPLTEPDIESLPQEWKDLFEGPLKLMMGSKVCLAVLQDRRAWCAIEQARLILQLIKHPDFISYETQLIAIELTSYFNLLSTTMAIGGRFLFEGPASRQFQTQRSEFLGVGNVEEKKPLFGLK